MYEYKIGKVVGTRIRVDSELPIDYTGWHSGDIFIHSKGLHAMYEYQPNNLDKLIFLSNLKGEADLFKHNVELKYTDSLVYLYFSITTSNPNELTMSTVLNYFPENFPIQDIGGYISERKCIVDSVTIGYKEGIILNILYLKDGTSYDTITYAANKFTCTDTVLTL